jgi:hypothetical protein
MDAGLPATIPAVSTSMACGTSMVGAFEAAGMVGCGRCELALVGGVDSLSRVQIGLSQPLSDWVRALQQARSIGEKLSRLTELRIADLKLCGCHLIMSTMSSNNVLIGQLGNHVKPRLKSLLIHRSCLKASLSPICRDCAILAVNGVLNRTGQYNPLHGSPPSTRCRSVISSPIWSTASGLSPPGKDAGARMRGRSDVSQGAGSRMGASARGHVEVSRRRGRTARATSATACRDLQGLR